MPTATGTPVQHFTRHYAQRILAEGLPEGMDVLNLNVPSSAGVDTEVRLTVQSRRSYYAHLAPARSAAEQHLPGRLGVRIELDPPTLEPDSDIKAVAVDGVVSVTPLTSSMTVNVDWQP